MTRSFTPFVLLASAVAISVCGCFGNGALEQVHGTVTYSDGTPVSGGVLTFAAVEGNSSSVGYLKEDGTYVLGTFDEADGAPQGKYNVTISGAADYGGKSPIAAKYSQIGQSPLQADVADGDNTIDFQVERAKK